MRGRLHGEAQNQAADHTELVLRSDTEELCRLVPGIVRTAKAKGIPVNHEQLYCDLTYWNGGRAKIEWAEAYWGTAGGES